MLVIQDTKELLSQIENNLFYATSIIDNLDSQYHNNDFLTTLNQEIEEVFEMINERQNGYSTLPLIDIHDRLKQAELVFNDLQNHQIFAESELVFELISVIQSSVLMIDEYVDNMMSDRNDITDIVLNLETLLYRYIHNSPELLNVLNNLESDLDIENLYTLNSLLDEYIQQSNEFNESSSQIIKHISKLIEVNETHNGIKLMNNHLCEIMERVKNYLTPLDDELPALLFELKSRTSEVLLNER